MALHSGAGLQVLQCFPRLPGTGWSAHGRDLGCSLVLLLPAAQLPAACCLPALSRRAGLWAHAALQ